ncbi:hypothetical protein D3872_22290, partial [Massilia cavernae]
RDLGIGPSCAFHIARTIDRVETACCQFSRFFDNSKCGVEIEVQFTCARMCAERKDMVQQKLMSLKGGWYWLISIPFHKPIGDTPELP